MNTFKPILDKLQLEDKLTLGFTNIIGMYIDGLFLDNNIYGLSNMANKGEEPFFVWIHLPNQVLSKFFSENEYIEFIDMLTKIPKGRTVIADGYFLFHVDIDGKVSEARVPSEDGIKGAKVIAALSIKKSDESIRWIRGSMHFDTGKGKFIQQNDSYRKKISNILENYVDTPVFEFLTNEILKSPSNESEYKVIICESCGKLETYHISELGNVADYKKCRKCGYSRYTTLTEVPFTSTFLLNLYYYMNNIFENYIYKGKEANDEIINYVLKYGIFDNPSEAGITYNYIRNLVKKQFAKSRYDLLIKFENIIVKVKELDEFKELLINMDKSSSLTSLQTTSDTSRVFQNIRNKINHEIFEFYYPHPLKKKNKEEDYFIINDIVEENFMDIANLYKDTFDLIGDHWFLSNLGLLLNGNPVLANCINENLFGKKLLDQTLKYVKNTQLEPLVKGIYNTEIRNAIAHPGRYVDPISKEVSIYNKGQLVRKISIDEFQIEVEKLIDFHLELNYLKYKLTLSVDKKFLATGGILSIQPDLFGKNQKEMEPFLVINQLATFKEYSLDSKEWANRISISTIEDNDDSVIQITISREKSILWENILVCRSTYGISEFVKIWIEKVIESGEIVVAHRFCYIPVELNVEEKEFDWIPIMIPISRIQEDVEYFMKSMRISQKIKIESSLKEKLKRLIS